MSTETLNALSRASSAYLRSAMHQPIQWHEWGEDAFAKAQLQNKPILLDIGAVWCHWCHVMDRESYDNPEIAQLINERFIAIKVDRDERPDIDIRYQAAVSAVSGQGGWPLTAFLTPDGKPFYGGTYFPPDDHYGRPSFKRVLTSISEAYTAKYDDISEQARMVVSVISQSESFAEKSGAISPDVIDEIVKSALKMYDDNYGGFGNAPKFPHPAVLDLLIDQYGRTGDARLREVFATTLENMARGGVYDQLAGGFHRYSVDERWIVPHFEKMCYDNSELLKNYVHAYQATGSDSFATIARDVIRWMDEWLSDRERGGFYASQDADYSMDDDGDYFTWSAQEADESLTEDEAEVAKLHYDINEIGEMHHNPAKNVLYVRAPVEEISSRLKIPIERVEQLLRAAKEKMYAARLKRPTPYVDKTIYAGWNSLCISAYLEASRVFNLDSARHFALRSLDRALAEGWTDDGGLVHVIAYSDAAADRRKTAGLLDDYAFTAIACLDAYEATSDISYFRFAERITDWMLEHFFDSAGGGFFDSDKNSSGKTFGVLGTTRKPFQDSQTPAGNPVAAIALMRIYAYTHRRKYFDRAGQTLALLGSSADQFGIFAATYAIAVIYFSQNHTQVVIIGEDIAAEKLYESASAPFSVGKAVIKFAKNAVRPENLPPALAETIPQLPAVKNERSAAVICSNFTCQGPISNPQELNLAVRKAIHLKVSNASEQ